MSLFSAPGNADETTSRFAGGRVVRFSGKLFRQRSEEPGVPVEAKPLFRPEVLRSHVTGLRLPPNASGTMAKWGLMSATGLSE